MAVPEVARWQPAHCRLQASLPPGAAARADAGSIEAARATATDILHYPARWDPFFTDYMTLADLFRYPASHCDSHRRQLTPTPRRESPARP